MSYSPLLGHLPSPYLLTTLYHIPCDAARVPAGRKKVVERQAGLHVSLSLPNATDNTIMPPSERKRKKRDLLIGHGWHEVSHVKGNWQVCLLVGNGA